MLKLVLLAPLVGFAVALPITWLLVRAGTRLGAFDTPGHAGHVKELRRVPNIGGIGIVTGVALPLAVALLAIGFGSELLRDLAPAIDPLLPRLRSSLPAGVGLLGCMLALHVLGLVDDRRSLGPWVKLGVQVVTAAVMVAFFDTRLLTALDGLLPLGPWPSIVLSVLWIVVIVNAINFLDNMDGLAGGVSAVAASVLMAATCLNAQWFVAALLGLLIGALVAFLVFNFPPARIFMGDGGSLVVGFLLAVATARTVYVDPSQPDYALGTAWYGVFMPLVVLAVPIYDFTSVTLIRLMQGKSPFVGDQQHFSHRLVQRGLSRRGAVVVIWSLTAVTGISGIALGSLLPWQAMLVGVQTILVLMVLAIFEYASRRASESAR